MAMKTLMRPRLPLPRRPPVRGGRRRAPAPARSTGSGANLPERLLDDGRDVEEADAAVQERADGDLVGGVQDARGGAAGHARLAGQGKAAEGRDVGRLEVQAERRRQVERLDRRRRAMRMGERPRDRHAHVGKAGVGEQGAVAEAHHPVDDRLRVHDDLDGVVGDPEQVMRLDHLEALVHQRGRVDRDLLPHAPGRVGERLGRGHVGELVAAAAAKRAARGGDDDPGHRTRSGALEALRERRVLAVDRQEPPPARRGCARARAPRRPRGSPCSRAPRRRPPRRRPASRGGRRRPRSRSGRGRRRSRRSAPRRPPRPAARSRRRGRARPLRRRRGRRARRCRTPVARAAATSPSASRFAESAHARRLGASRDHVEGLPADGAGRSEDGHGSHAASLVAAGWGAVTPAPRCRTAGRGGAPAAARASRGRPRRRRRTPGPRRGRRRGRAR